MFWTGAGVSADDRINGAVQTDQNLQIFIIFFFSAATFVAPSALVKEILVDH